MTIDTKALLGKLESHLLTLGKFDSVNRHEPKSPPTGVTAACWVIDVSPTAAFTALAATSALITFNIRIYDNMLEEPQDDIDPKLMEAVDAIFTLVSGDFTLGEAVDFVDLLGQSGKRLEARSGYAPLGNRMYRVFDITVPVVIGDAWAQAR